MVLAQDDTYLPSASLLHTFSLGPDRKTATITLARELFVGGATKSGDLTAKLLPAPGLELGRTTSATVRMIAMDPAITIRPDRGRLRITSGETPSLPLVARTAAGLPRPNREFSVLVSSRRGRGTFPGDDYVVPPRIVIFEPGDLHAAGGAWEARRQVVLPTVGDGMLEPDETVELTVRTAPGAPQRVRPRKADGSVCPNDVCMAPLTMRAGDGPDPVLTIAAEREVYGYEIDDFAFVVTAAGPRDEAVEATVTLTQEDSYMPEARLSRTVRIEPGETSATLLLELRFQADTATRSGALTATIAPGNGYAVGTPGTATARIVVLDRAITVRPEHGSYRFVEGQAQATVAFVARTEPGLPRPTQALRAAVSSIARRNGASAPEDYASLSRLVFFRPGDFVPGGGSGVRQWVARKEVALEIHRDDETESDEIFDLNLTRAPGLASRARLRQADGRGCPRDICVATVTIVDNEGLKANRIAITPVPPEASADHGPYYRKDGFLALPDDAVHGRGAALTFTLTLDAEVTVTGIPELVLDVFGRERRARYAGGSGTRELTFTWTVAKGDNDPNGPEFVSLDLNGGTIRDTQGHSFAPETLPAQHFAAHRVRGGLFAMRLAISGPAREGEPFEIRVVRDGGFEEPALGLVGVTDSALPHVPQLYSHALNGPGGRGLLFEAGAADATGTVTPVGDGEADDARTLTVRLLATDTGFSTFYPDRDFQSWYVADGPLEATVPVTDAGLALAMAGLRVQETSTTEAPGAKLAFRVTLSPRSDAPVMVDYRTRDGSPNVPGDIYDRRAVAGSDYVATDGTLTFQPGETEKTVEVEVLADDHDEDIESMRLVLSNARGARIDKESGLGTIRNTGPIPTAWIARFGRTVADQVLDAVESRMRAARRPGFETTLAGRSVGAQGAPARSRREIDRDFDPTTSLSDWRRGRYGPDWREGRGLRPRVSRVLTPRDLLTGTSFAVTAETERSDYVSLWGRGAVTRLDGREGRLTLDGEVTSAMVGADWLRGPASGSGSGAWIAGLIVSHSIGEGGYAGSSRGRVESTLTGLYPWGRLALSERVDAWGTAGYGTGELEVTLAKPVTDEDAAAARADLDLRMAAAGLRGTLFEGGADGFNLTGKTDALIVRTATGRGHGPDDGNLAAARATVTRLRLGLEGARSFGLGGGAVLTPSIEIGIRHDGGDAETGFGLDLGGGLAWIAPGPGLSAEVRARGLATHEADGFGERGFSGSLAWDPRPSSERGPELTLTHTLGGPASGGTDALLARSTFAGLSESAGAGTGPETTEGGDLRSRRLEARFGYGRPALGGRFTWVPELGFGLSDTGRDWSLGWRLLRADSGSVSSSLGLSAVARRVEGTGAGSGRSPDHRIGVRLTARW